MDIQARVSEVRRDCARLVCDPAICGACAEGGGCGAGLLGFRPGRCLDLPLSPERLARLAPGDPIVLSVKEGALVRAAALACSLPVAGLLAGAALARLAGAGEAIAPFAAVAGALVGVRVGRRLAAGRLRGFLGDHAQCPDDG